MGFSVDDAPLVKIGEVIGDAFDVDVKYLEWVSRAMSTESTRYYLNGIYFDKGAMVATDGHRLFKCKVEGANGNLIMPALTVKGVIAVAKAVGATKIVITPHSSGMFVAIGKCEVVTKAIDGTYPDYMRVVPNHEASTRFDIRSVNKADKIVPMVNAASGSPSLHCKIGGGLIQAVSSEAWSTESKFTAEIRGFNVKYLKSVGMDGDCFVGAPEDPIKIINGNRMAVVMPVRI
jgi:DNA polymerase-3 subunit beta